MSEREMRFTVNGNLKILCTAASLLVAGAVAYATLRSDVTHQGEEGRRQGSRVDAHDQAVSEFRRDLDWIKDALKGVSAKLDRLAEEQKGGK